MCVYIYIYDIHIMFTPDGAAFVDMWLEARGSSERGCGRSLHRDQRCMGSLPETQTIMTTSKQL